MKRKTMWLTTILLFSLPAVGSPELNKFSCTVLEAVSGGMPNLHQGDRTTISAVGGDDLFEFTSPSGNVIYWPDHPALESLPGIPSNAFSVSKAGEIIAGDIHVVTSIDIENVETRGTHRAWFRSTFEVSGSKPYSRITHAILGCTLVRDE